MKPLPRILLQLLLILTLFLPGSLPAVEAQTSGLRLVSPSACPPDGCAAGQRLSLRAEYTLTRYVSDSNPNVQVCLYTPSGWSVGSAVESSSVGEVTGVNYTAGNLACDPPPANYTLSSHLNATLSTGLWASDSLDLNLRIGKEATANGSLLLAVYERNAEGWVRSLQSALPLSVTPTSATVFVAADAASCGNESPCYINSAGDLPNGIGTGLKDAIDAATSPGEIRILGSFPIKSQTVVVDRALEIRGVDDASLTYTGAVCTQPMLQFTAGGSLRELNINDGSCANPGRDLVVVQSSDAILVEGNDLKNGENAIRVLPSAGLVTVRFNHINGNTGYALLREPGDPPGTVELIANNLYGNRAGIQVECNNRGTARHNFWGSGTLPTAAASNCQVTDATRLGAPIVQPPDLPGVDAKLVTVGEQKAYEFDGQIGFQRSGSGSDFPLYIVNHGRLTGNNVPFGNTDNLYACSNFWDVFLAQGSAPTGTLNLFFKYVSDSNCVAAIELSTEYCKHSDPARFPLWWHDPANSITNGWDTTGWPLGSGAGGASGQDTICRPNDNEIQVLLDTSGRPGLISDLGFTPFVVALRSAAISSLTAEAGNQEVRVRWTVASEVNTRGYFVLRGDTRDGSYTYVSNFIAAKGGDMTVTQYDYLDDELTNNQTYFYKLEIVNNDLMSFFSEPVSAVPAVPTVTPTMTGTVTRTPTRTITIRPMTMTPTRTPFRSATPRFQGGGGTIIRTATPSRTPTGGSGTPGTLTISPTFSGSTTVTPFGSAEPGEEGPYPGSEETPGGEQGYPGEITPLTTAAGDTSPTVTLTATLAAPVDPGDDKGTPGGTTLAVGGLVVGALLGLGVLGLGGWLLWRRGLLPAGLGFFPPAPKPHDGDDLGPPIS